jgi:4-amino-4-deoxy-L-arabinose transferase-like glycosyltransferase
MRLTAPPYVLVVAKVAFLIRLAAVLLLRDIAEGPTGAPSNDDVQFYRLGRSLAEGEGYCIVPGKPTSFRAPGFPFLLAAVFATTGDHPPVIYVLNCFLGSLACVLAYFIGREILSEDLARLAGVLGCFYLGHIYFATQYISENLFVPLLALAIWATIRYLKGGPMLLVGAAGILLGYATLTRPMAVLLLGLLPPLFAVRDIRAGKWPLVSCGLYAAAFLVVLLPWTCRNYGTHGHVVLVATNGGSTFYGANNERVVTETRNFGYWIATNHLPHRDLIDAQPDEYSHDKMEWKLGTDWIRDHPAQAALLLVFKSLRLWWLPDFASGTVNYILRIVLYAPYFILFCAAAMRVVRHGEYWTLPWLAVHVTMLATLLTALIFFGDPRFRDANLPLLMLYSALGATALPNLWTRRKQVPAALTANRATHRPEPEA